MWWGKRIECIELCARQAVEEQSGDTRSQQVPVHTSRFVEESSGRNGVYSFTGRECRPDWLTGLYRWTALFVCTAGGGGLSGGGVMECEGVGSRGGQLDVTETQSIEWWALVVGMLCRWTREW